MRRTRIGLDIKILGGLFLIFGTVDLVVIALFPAYAFKLFGVAVTGPSSYLVKLHSPAVHLLIGYGFLWLRPWAWGLSLAYAGCGIRACKRDHESTVVRLSSCPIGIHGHDDTLCGLCNLETGSVYRRRLGHEASP